MRDLIRRWSSVAPVLEQQAGRARRPLSSVRLRAPVLDPSKIVAAPVNYLDHMTEMSEENHISSLGVFLKAPSAILDPGGTIQLPYTDRRFDQEGELALIIGRRAHNVSEEAALDHVFGYTGLLDITMRGGEDRSTRKSFDTFAPLGPWLVAADEIGSPDSIDLRCSVNGGLRQSANTRDLIWGVPALVSYISSVMTLEPGDVIATGTPAGVGSINAGDTIELELSRIGSLRTSVAADHAVPCPTKGAGRGPVPPPPPEQVGD
ncbi:MAG: FAA hydrolase family protein [Streptosporangiales bacterium]|nr:FAA hydrolase family protein [Streptosporangiales bacterium]